MTAKTYKVRRDGAILVDGEAVGRVRKISSDESNWATWRADLDEAFGRPRYGATRKEAVEAALRVRA